MIIVREATDADLRELHFLAETLNTVNLQPDENLLREQIEWSRKSFRHKIPLEDSEYLFVLEDDGDLIGTSLIIAQHGTYERPSVYFKVRYVQKYSTSLKAHFKHQVMDLIFDYTGPTEIGGLIVNPMKRRKGRKKGNVGYGKALSFARFLYIAMNRGRFRNEIVAELLPELRKDGKSDLWEAFGQKFCGIDYQEADRRSRDDIEFIRSLFPMFPIYTTFLPEKVQKQIGIVGEKTKPAKSLLTRLGFYWDHTIDPFDGGPTYRCETDRCLAVRRTTKVKYIGVCDDVPKERGERKDDSEEKHVALVAKMTNKDSLFVSAVTEYEREFEGVRLEYDVAEKLNLKQNDEIAFMPFSGINLIDF